MSDILDAIDKIANASVEAMNKLPEVPDDVTWAWKILESVDGAGVRAAVSLTHIIEKLEIMSYGSSIISPDVVSYDAEKRLREAVAMMSDWKQRFESTTVELEVAAVRMIIVCEILRLYRSDSDLHNLINHGLIGIMHRMNNDCEDVRLVFDSGETAAVVASFPCSVWGDRAIDGLEGIPGDDFSWCWTWKVRSKRPSHSLVKCRTLSMRLAALRVPWRSPTCLSMTINKHQLHEEVKAHENHRHHK